MDVGAQILGGGRQWKITNSFTDHNVTYSSRKYTSLVEWGVFRYLWDLLRGLI